MKLLATLVIFVLGAVGLFAAMLHFPIFAIFSYPLVGLGMSVAHERRWRRRRHWIRTRGTVVGHVVGTLLGDTAGVNVGSAVGEFDGIAVGAFVGLTDGDTVGDTVGLNDGNSDGDCVGRADGASDGDVDGDRLGVALGA